MTTIFEAQAGAPYPEASANLSPTIMPPELDPSLSPISELPETPTTTVGVFGNDEKIADLEQLKKSERLTTGQETMLAGLIQDGLVAREEATLYQEKEQQVPLELSLRVKQGSQAELMMLNSVEGLLYYLLERQKGRLLPNEDYLQQARLKLLEAVRRYDPTVAHWSTMASNTISGTYRKMVNRVQPLIPSRDAENAKGAVMRSFAALSEVGEEPTANAISARTGINIETVVAVLANGHTDSLDAEFAHDGAPITLGERLPDPADGYRQLIGRMLVPEAMAAIHEVLSERDAQIIIARFGLDGSEPKTQTEIGDMVGVSQMHVSRLITRSLKVLRNLPVMQDLHEVTL